MICVNCGESEGIDKHCLNLSCKWFSCTECMFTTGSTRSIPRPPPEELLRYLKYVLEEIEEKLRRNDK